MPEFKDKLKVANEFVGMIPEVNQMTGKVLELNKKMPEIEQYGGLVYQVQGKIPEIQDAGRQINKIDNDFGDVVQMMDDAIVEAKKGLGIIQDAQKELGKVNKLTIEAKTLIDDTSKTLNKISKETLPKISESVQTGIEIVQTISEGTIKITDKLIQIVDKNELTSEEKNAIYKELLALSTRLEAQSEMIQSIIETLVNLQNLNGSHNLDGIIGQLQHTKSVVDSANQRINYILDDWENISSSSESLKEALIEVNQLAKAVNDEASNINVSAIQAEVDKLIAEAQAVLATAKNITDSIIADDLIKNVDELMTSTSKTINQAIAFLESYQKELPA
ncbi:hypothetical protein ACODH7_18640, partial [Vagococcus fluvialis]